MATFGDAVDLILTEITRTDTSITVVTEREFRKAIEHYAPMRFWFNEARISFTASNTIYYPLANLSSEMVEIDQLSTTVNGGRFVLEPETHQRLNELDSVGVTGYPAKWAIFAQQFRLYPKAPSGSTYQIDVDGTKRLPTLSVSTDNNSWTTEALDLIAARVEKMLFAKRFKDPNMAATYAQVEAEELQKLQDRTTRILSSGKISPGY